MIYPVLNPTQALQNLQAKSYPFWDQYYAFFSTWYGGIIKNPGPLLTVPFDDHVVHRGDGVFEALKTTDRKIYLLHQHLDRLIISAEKIGIPLPFAKPQMVDIILQTLKIADQSDTVVRIFLTRGPGGFTANPYESIASQFYVIITKLGLPNKEKYTDGIHIGKSKVPVKEGMMPQIKSCNYLPNVLMKKEAVDRNLEFTVNFDQDNKLAESATENIIILDQDDVLTHPNLEKILKGTTMIRAFELAKRAGIKTNVRSISENDLLTAKEVMMTGTTFTLLPVVSYESKVIGDGKVGNNAKAILKMIEDDMKNGTPY